MNGDSRFQPSIAERLRDPWFFARTGTLEELVAAAARIEELEGALKIARLMIRNEIIENAVVDTQTMQSLGNTIDAALQPKAAS